MKSNTLIVKQTKKKTNPELAMSIIEARKNEKWFPISAIISGPRSRRAAVNLDKIDKIAKEGDTIVVPGKVLGVGKISKKIRISALAFSEEAKEKLKDKKCEIVTILEEIKSNPKASGIKLIR